MSKLKPLSLTLPSTWGEGNFTCMERLHAVVRGDVQGVGFRYYVQRKARQLGLPGWVRNNEDGSVELVAEGARRAGIRVAFEFLGFRDCPVNTPALAAEVVDRVEGIEMVLDSCHWHASGGRPLGDYPVDRLALVHLNDAPQAKPGSEIQDADRILPGEGVISLRELINELRSRGYSGPWSLETFNPSYWGEDPAQVAKRGLAAVKNVLR